MKKITAIMVLLTAALLFSRSGFAFLRTEMTPLVISTAQNSWLFGKGYSGINPAADKGNVAAYGSLSYQTRDSDTGISSLFASYSEENTTYGLGLSFMNTGGLEGRDVPSEEPDYEFGSKAFTASFVYSYRFARGISAGLEGKYSYEKIEYDDSYAFTVSAGIFMKDAVIEGLNAGLSVNNYGDADKFDTESPELPLDAVAGIGYGHIINGDFSLKAGITARYLWNDEETEEYAGTEISYLERIFVRAGYRFGNEGMPFSAGLGFMFSHITADYSFTPFTEDNVDANHAVSVSYYIK